jgi:hypothetical protein
MTRKGSENQRESARICVVCVLFREWLNGQVVRWSAFLLDEMLEEGL